MTRVMLVAGQASGGVVRQLVEHCHALETLGHQAVIAAPPKTLDCLPEAVGHLETVVLDIGERPSGQDRATMKKLRDHLVDIDVLHAHGARAGALACLAARGHKGGERSTPLRVVVTLHNKPVGSPLVCAVGAGLIQIIATLADVVLAVSPDLVRRVRRAGMLRAGTRRLTRHPQVPTELAIVAAPGQPPEDQLDLPQLQRKRQAARFTLGWSDRDVIIVTIARLAPQKGLDTVLAAAAKLGERASRFDNSDSWRWLIVGDGPLEKDLTASITALGLSEHVILTGHRADVPVLLQAASIVVNCAVWEGQSVALMESLQAGAAIVATDVGGTRSVLQSAGRHVKSGDPDALADMIAAVASSDLAQDRMRLASIRRAGTLPRVGDLAEQLERVYTGHDPKAATDASHH